MAARAILSPSELPEAVTGSASAALRWAIDTFGDRFAVVTALQAEGMVVLDLARRIDPDVRVLTVDTGRLPQETHDFLDTVRAQLDVRVEVVLPDPDAVAAMVGAYGTNLFRGDPALRRLCCHVRKVEPLTRALEGLDAWATGLRRDATAARAGVARVELDAEHGGIVKLNPLADWTSERVWAYVRAHRLPVHPLYRQGYTSIGCAPCTRPTGPGEPERAGRWWWEAGADRECGLHSVSRDERFTIALTDLQAAIAARGEAPQPAATNGRR